MRRPTLDDLRHHLQEDNWVIDEVQEDRLIFIHPAGRTLTVWVGHIVDGIAYIERVLPGRHIARKQSAGNPPS